MKKLFLSIAVIAVVLTTSSCGTILGGKITDCQKSKPATGHRQMRWAAFIFDGPWGWAVDFATGGMYKPCDKK